MQKSMSLKYEPASEPLRISVKLLFPGAGVLCRGECSKDKADFGGPASRYGTLNFFFQVALYLPPWAQVYFVGLNAVKITLCAGVFFLLYYSQA